MLNWVGHLVGFFVDHHVLKTVWMILAFQLVQMVGDEKWPAMGIQQKFLLLIHYNQWPVLVW